MAKSAKKADKASAPKAKSKPRRPVLWALKWGATAAVWLVVIGLCVAGYYAYDLPSVDDALAAYRRPSVTLLAADGARFAQAGDQAGAAVRLSDMPAYLPKALIDVEDKRFYEHGALDWQGIARAVLVNIRAGGIRQGGSTLTQQAAKNLFLSPERTLKRKIQEVMLAYWLERRFTKDQILTIYLNRVYFGAGAYGVQAAAERFFGVAPAQLSLYEAAVLVGSLKAPSRLNPLTGPDAARARAKVVLAAMVDAGDITAAQAKAAAGRRLAVRPAMAAGQGGRYFVDWVTDALPGFVGPDAGDITVATTIDPGLQRAAEKAVRKALAKGPPDRQAAVVVITPDGAVRAMVGGRSYAQSQFNRAVLARRQPGSAFKPFVYLAGLEAGITPDTVLTDAPVEIDGWRPRNFEGTYEGRVTAAEALARSINTVAVKVGQEAGFGAVARVAERLGITSPLRATPSLALGASEVGVLELTAAYGAFATEGVAVWPFGITEIRGPDGGVLYRRQGDGPPRVVPAAEARTLTTMLKRVMTEGTGRRAALGKRPAAGKTGTSQDSRDAWFVGYTADFVAGVWVGNDDGAPMKGVTGGGEPARIWHDVMAAAEMGLPARPIAAAAEPENAPGFWQRLMNSLGG